MKKYIIFRTNITGMGGAQMYTRNKAVFKSREGYKVFVFSAKDGEIFIEDLKQYKDGVFPELRLSPNCFPKRKLRAMLDRLLKHIDYNKGDDVFIESNDVIMSLWGELLAADADAKHVSFVLNERFGNFERSFKDYFAFKNARGELAGIREEIIADYFLDKNTAAYKKLVAIISNSVDDCDHPVLREIDSSKINIASIGRLDKSYVPTLTQELAKVAEKHGDREFEVTFIGDSQESAVKEQIAKTFSDIKNLSYRITGFMYPVPEKLFPMIDVFVSAAGSAWSSYYEKRPTVSIDVDTFKAIGIMGGDTMSTIKTVEGDSPRDISDAVEEILFGEPINYDYTKGSRSSLDALSLHDDYWNEGSKEHEYFDIASAPRSKAEKLLSAFMNVFGTRFTVNFAFAKIQSIRKR